jgi:hypothetical protein
MVGMQSEEEREGKEKRKEKKNIFEPNHAKLQYTCHLEKKKMPRQIK